jgi:hypothetical protein
LLFPERLCQCLKNTEVDAKSSIRWSTGNERARESTQGAEGVCNPIGRTTKSTNQSSQGLNHQPRSTHRGTHGSSHICSRRWSCQALGPVKARCPSVRECKGWETRVGGWVGGWGYTLLEAGGGWMGWGLLGGLGKGITFEM